MRIESNVRHIRLRRASWDVAHKIHNDFLLLDEQFNIISEHDVHSPEGRAIENLVFNNKLRWQYDHETGDMWHRVPQVQHLALGEKGADSYVEFRLTLEEATALKKLEQLEVDAIEKSASEKLFPFHKFCNIKTLYTIRQYLHRTPGAKPSDDALYQLNSFGHFILAWLEGYVVLHVVHFKDEEI